VHSVKIHPTCCDITSYATCRFIIWFPKVEWSKVARLVVMKPISTLMWCNKSSSRPNINQHQPFAIGPSYRKWWPWRGCECHFENKLTKYARWVNAYWHPHSGSKELRWDLISWFDTWEWMVWEKMGIRMMQVWM